ncbi:hypothetical protein NUH30_03520 [Leptospira sp. 85282-16]|uniref:hypothetical protein n=1 Tax=Leptospira sp. 85282-16 TaxID=2971256 RepID=UPI0021BEFE04|nr:hypothetical protein [Leptospira sp. 85282-16]MCT8332731.1 hypothetical protein [Leptospira sp. 85282-16]
MSKFFYIIICCNFVLNSCVFFRNEKDVSHLHEENQEIINISYSYIPKECIASLYNSGEDFNLWTNEKILEDTFKDAEYKIKSKKIVYNFHKYPKEKIHMNIKLFQRYGCIFEYDYNLKDRLNDIWLYLSGSTLFIIPYYGTSGIVSEISVSVNGQVFSIEEYLLPIEHASFLFLFPLTVYNFVLDRNRYTLPELLDSIEMALSKISTTEN